MSALSIIFIIVFVLPLLGFMIWLVLQDKQKGKKALIALALSIVYYFVWKTTGWSWL